MSKAVPWSILPQIWLSIGLPGFRKETTYQGYDLDKMPPIPIDLGENLAWLCTYGSLHPGEGLDRLEELARPLPPTAALDFAEQANLHLPQSFVQFLSSPDLQSRVKSCTDCYLDPGQRIVETVGQLQGSLIHFLSDSQCCAHWYLHVLQTGESAVLESDDLYCYLPENAEWIENPACRLAQIDLAELDFRFCSSSFSEFLFRFWIENEIWFAIHGEKSERPLTPLEVAYLAGRR